MAMNKALLFAVLLTILHLQVYAQDTDVPSKEPRRKERPERPAFENTYVINFPNQELPGKKGLEAQIQHRFGLVNAGVNDFAGIWAPANIRLGVSYGIAENWTIGFGMTKFDRLYDANLKVALMRQTRSGSIPVSISYFGTVAADSRSRDFFPTSQDRFSFYHQISITRRMGRNVSLMLAPNLSHYNLVDAGVENDTYAILLAGRFKISPRTSILVEYNQPFYLEDVDPSLESEPGIGFGVEFATLGHAFQIFITNQNGIVPQKNVAQNPNDFFNGDFLLGFNITRTYKFQ